MASRDNSDRPEVLSRRLMTELAVGAISALQDGGFVDEIDLLCERVFRLSPDRLFDTDPGQDDAWTLSYKPMVELALLHIRDIARSECSYQDKQDGIRWVLVAAGF